MLELTSYIRPLWIRVDEDAASSPAASQSMSRCGSDASTPRTSFNGASSEVVQNTFDSHAATTETNETGVN